MIGVCMTIRCRGVGFVGYIVNQIFEPVVKLCVVSGYVIVVSAHKKFSFICFFRLLYRLFPFGEFPRSFWGFPNPFGVFPDSFGGCPVTFGEFPRSFGKCPDLFGVFPKSFGAFPKSFGAFPRSFG